MLETVSPVTLIIVAGGSTRTPIVVLKLYQSLQQFVFLSLIIVAGGSTRTPIVVMIGRASIGKPYNVIIINSPINPPPGIPLITIPDNRQIPIAVVYVPIPVKSISKTPNTKAIFNIAARHDPSI